MMDMNCPYCDFELEADDDCREEDTPYEKECPHCLMVFIYYIAYYPSFTVNKAPCLNGGEHDYQPIIGYPKEHFENKKRCSYCANEIDIIS